MEAVGTLLPLVLLFLAFYALIIRPARGRQRAQQRLVEQLSVGIQVMTTSGLYAQIVDIVDDTVLLEVAPGVRVRWAKVAVARVVTPDAQPDADDASASGSGEADTVQEAAAEVDTETDQALDGVADDDRDSTEPRQP